MPLAQIGIHNGKKVDLTGPLVESSRSRIDDFSESLLSQQGFLRIGRKIVAHEILSDDEVRLLFERAPLAVLAKLAQIARPLPSEMNVTPVMALPLKYWIEFRSDLRKMGDLAISMLQAVEAEHVQVMFDSVHSVQLTLPVKCLIERILKCRKGLTLVAPNAEDIAAQLGESSDDVGSLGKQSRFYEVLQELRVLGFGRIRSSYDVGYLPFVKEAGFQTGVLADVRHSDRFVEDLLSVRRLAQRQQCIDAWSPGISTGKRTLKDKQIYEGRLLRALALGAVTLRDVETIRASSHCFSLQALSMAHLFGATDLGFGAFDQTTGDLLWLESFDAIRRVDPMKSSRR